MTDFVEWIRAETKRRGCVFCGDSQSFRDASGGGYCHLGASGEARKPGAGGIGRVRSKCILIAGQGIKMHKQSSICVSFDFWFSRPRAEIILYPYLGVSNL
jgi:hypothetical protein